MLVNIIISRERDIDSKFKSHRKIDQAGYFTKKLKMKEQLIEDDYKDDKEEEVENGEDNDDDEDEFSFACGIDTLSIAANEAFYNGQIQHLFQLFNQNLLLSDKDLEGLKKQLPIRTLVKKIFIQTEDNSIPATSSSSEEFVGPFYEWSKNKAIEASPDNHEVCKKSNSTGFSKLWRFKDFLHWINNDERNTFVFLKPTTTVAKVEEYIIQKMKKMFLELDKKKISGEIKVIGKVTKKKGVKKSEGVVF
ncbi:uncharacterized protein LOC129883620 [Solanum dulcamara]|uniref:uncharacterized protein LOC129883620 n=1 Tax=Solanum dulcamara TaxID=45834 RepID=UPI002485E46B|nr:uncharacterized protein LOC129883620 [Solanum dulcamara]